MSGRSIVPRALPRTVRVLAALALATALTGGARRRSRASPGPPKRGTDPSGGTRPERGLPVLGRPEQRCGPPGARLGEGGARRGGEDPAADLRAAGGRLARVGRPGPGDPGRRAVRRPHEEDRRARGVQHPAPRLRAVLRRRREGRGRLPFLDRGVRRRRRGRPRDRDPGAGRAPPHRGRLHPARAPHRALPAPLRGGGHTGGPPEHQGLPGRGQPGLDRRAGQDGAAAAAGGRPAGRRLLAERLQLPVERQREDVRGTALRRGGRLALRDRHQPQRQRPSVRGP